MKIKLDHVNLTVGDLKTSITWYEAVFGFQLVEKGTSHTGKKWAIVAYDDSSDYDNVNAVRCVRSR